MVPEGRSRALVGMEKKLEIFDNVGIAIIQISNRGEMGGSCAEVNKEILVMLGLKAPCKVVYKSINSINNLQVPGNLVCLHE